MAQQLVEAFLSVLLPQDANIERLTHKMKQLKLIPQSWHPPDVVLATSPTAGGKSHIIDTPPSAERLPRGELESPTWKTISADKLETLRDYLSNIEHVPVRRVKTSEETLLMDFSMRFSGSDNNSCIVLGRSRLCTSRHSGKVWGGINHLLLCSFPLGNIYIAITVWLLTVNFFAISPC